MSVWSLRALLGWMYLAFGIMATLAHGAEAIAPELATHPLVIATETLYQRKLPQACDQVVKLTLASPGLTVDDLIRVHFVAAMRGVDGGNELEARKALVRVLQLDQRAKPPPFASRRLLTTFDETRVRHSSPTPAPVPAPAGAREPALTALLRAVDALYVSLELSGAVVVLDQARSLKPLTEADWAQVYLREGLLKVESLDEVESRKAFRKSLEADRGIRIPDFVPPKALRVFEEAKLEVLASASPPQLSPQSPAAQSPEEPGRTPSAGNLSSGKPAFGDSRSWGIVAGGAGLVFLAGGAVAGSVALSTYRAEQRASTSGDRIAYSESHDALRAVNNVADGLYGVGAVALGVGAFLFLSAPDRVMFGAGAGRGQALLVVGGAF